MGMLDNPSAGKFDPPPGAERFEAPRPVRKRSLLLGILLVVSIAGRESLGWLHLRGAAALALGLLTVTAAAAHFAMRRRLQPPDADTPYSEQQRITR